MNFVNRLNHGIAEFVTRPENLVLKPATGSYSTPFRGGLFGEHKASKVQQALRHNPAPVLMLGSNPNCPSSIGFIESGADGQGDWPGFVRQMASDEFGHLEFDPGGNPIRWDPLHNPASAGRGSFGWQFYADILEESLGTLDSVALANIYPWGSGSFDKIRKRMKDRAGSDGKLHERTIDFAQSQLDLMLECLQPRVVIAPKSLVSGRIAARLSISPNHLADRREIPIRLSNGRTFHLSTGNLHAKHHCPVLITNHPSSLLYLARSDRPAVRAQLLAVISQHADSS